MSEDRCQKTEDRWQRAEAGFQVSGFSSQG